MARKSRYQGYLNNMKAFENREAQHKETGGEAHSSPQSILAKLKALKGQAAVITVPVGDAHEG